MIKFEVDVSAVMRLAKLCPEMKDYIAKEIELAMTESGMLLTTMVAARTPVNFGILRASINFPAGYAVRGRPASMYTGMIRASDAAMPGASPHEYANYVEFGTRPHWPPRGPIALWAARKGLPAEAVGAIQATIAKRGTKGAHMFRKAWEEGGADKVRGFFEEVPVKAARRFAQLGR